MACRYLGGCTSSKGRCIVASDADCEKSEACKLRGECTFSNGMCQASDAGCAKTQACKLDGKCSASRAGSYCVAANGAECRAAEVCRRSGHCTAEGGRCVIASTEDCASAVACETEGICTFAYGQCKPGDAGCKRLPACKEVGECSVTTTSYGPLGCGVVTDEDCRDSTVCKLRGWCKAIEGHCFEAKPRQ